MNKKEIINMPYNMSSLLNNIDKNNDNHIKNNITKEFFSVLTNNKKIKIKRFDGTKILKEKHIRNSLFFMIVPKQERIVEIENTYDTGIIIGKYGKEDIGDGIDEFVSYTSIHDIYSDIYEADDIGLFCYQMNDFSRIDSFKNFDIILFKEIKNNKKGN